MLWRIAYRSFIIVWILVGVVVGISRRSLVQPVVLTVYEDVLPGQRLPPDASCEWPNYLPWKVHCSLKRDGTTIWLDFVPAEWRIRAAYYHVQGERRIGQWVLSKGRPVGFRREGNSIYIYWADGMTAYIEAQVLRPNSRILRIIFSAESGLDKAVAWRGFVNN